MEGIWRKLKRFLQDPTPTSRSNVVIRPKLSCRVDKNPATAAIIWKHRIATIAQNKNFVSNTFFGDSSDSSDGSDYMETRLKIAMFGGQTYRA